MPKHWSLWVNHSLGEAWGGQVGCSRLKKIHLLTYYQFSMCDMVGKGLGVVGSLFSFCFWPTAQMLRCEQARTQPIMFPNISKSWVAHGVLLAHLFSKACWYNVFPEIRRSYSLQKWYYYVLSICQIWAWYRSLKSLNHPLSLSVWSVFTGENLDIWEEK